MKQEYLVGHVRGGDFADSDKSMSTTCHPGKYYPRDKALLCEIRETVKQICKKFETFQELYNMCDLERFNGSGETDYYTYSDNFNYWVRLLPSRDSYNAYIKFYFKEEQLKISSTVFVAMLPPQTTQQQIKEIVIKELVTQEFDHKTVKEATQNAMDSRVCNLSELESYDTILEIVECAQLTKKEIRGGQI